MVTEGCDVAILTRGLGVDARGTMETESFGWRTARCVCLKFRYVILLPPFRQPHGGSFGERAAVLPPSKGVVGRSDVKEAVSGAGSSGGMAMAPPLAAAARRCLARSVLRMRAWARSSIRRFSSCTAMLTDVADRGPAVGVVDVSSALATSPDATVLVSDDGANGESCGGAVDVDGVGGRAPFPAVANACSTAA